MPQGDLQDIFCKLITSKLLTQCYRCHKLRKSFGKIFRSYSDVYQNLVLYRSKNTQEKESPNWYFKVILFTHLEGSGEQRISFSSGTKIVKRLPRRQYDQEIVERTTCLVFGPSTAMYRRLLKHCTLTNKVVVTTLRAFQNLR